MLLGMALGYVYAFWWDVVMDWGCVSSTRANIIFVDMPGCYWAPILVDFVLRFVWVFSLLPVLTQQHAEDVNQRLAKVLPILGVAEVCSLSCPLFDVLNEGVPESYVGMLSC